MPHIPYVLFITVKTDHVHAPKQEIVYKNHVLSIKDTLYDAKE